MRRDCRGRYRALAMTGSLEKYSQSLVIARLFQPRNGPCAWAIGNSRGNLVSHGRDVRCAHNYHHAGIVSINVISAANLGAAARLAY